MPAPTISTDTTPADAAVVHFEFTWCEGSVPPPDHYAFTITGSTSGEGQIVFVPGYRAEGPPQWVEAFVIAPHHSEALQAYLHTTQTLERAWPEVPNETVGGCQRSFRLRQGEYVRDIPADLCADDAADADGLERMIRAVVPEDMWRVLRNRHAAYIASRCP